jgi:hypothetical protein
MIPRRLRRGRIGIGRPEPSIHPVVGGAGGRGGAGGMRTPVGSVSIKPLSRHESPLGTPLRDGHGSTPDRFTGLNRPPSPKSPRAERVGARSLVRWLGCTPIPNAKRGAESSVIALWRSVRSRPQDDSGGIRIAGSPPALASPLCDDHRNDDQGAQDHKDLPCATEAAGCSVGDDLVRARGCRRRGAVHGWDGATGLHPSPTPASKNVPDCPGLDSLHGLPQAPADPTPHQGSGPSRPIHGLERRREEPSARAAPAGPGIHPRIVPRAPQDARRGGEMPEPVRTETSAPATLVGCLREEENFRGKSAGPLRGGPNCRRTRQRGSQTALAPKDPTG